MICEKTIDDLPKSTAFSPDNNCPVDRAKMLMEICSKNSCGCCVLCREGTLQVFEILNDVTTGKAEDGDIELILELCEVISKVAGCKQAKEIATQCIELIRIYPEEFEQHTRKRCNNLICKQYYTLHILPNDCTGCGECICPKNAIKGENGFIHIIDNDICNRCLECVQKCAVGCIKKAGVIKPKSPAEPIAVGTFIDDSSRRRRR